MEVNARYVVSKRVRIFTDAVEYGFANISSFKPTQNKEDRGEDKDDSFRCYVPLC
jgi:hypothetical protein